MRAGLLARTPRGRVATPAAWTHLGLAVPRGGAFTATLFEDGEEVDGVESGGPGPRLA